MVKVRFLAMLSDENSPVIARRLAHLSIYGSRISLKNIYDPSFERLAQLWCSSITFPSILTHSSVQYQNSEFSSTVNLYNCHCCDSFLWWIVSYLCDSHCIWNIHAWAYPCSDLFDQDPLWKLGIAFVHALAAFFPHGVLLALSLTLECPLWVRQWADGCPPPTTCLALTCLITAR